MEESTKKNSSVDHVRFETSGKLLVLSDRYSDQDKIGYQDHGDVLVDMIKSFNGEGSFTIGIYGKWGQGKTSMLRQIQKNICDEKDYDNKDILTLWFNPWQFSKEKHIIIPFFKTLTSEIEAKYGKEPAKLKSLWQVLKRAPEAILYGMEPEINIPFLFKLNLKFKEIFDKAGEIDKEIAKQDLTEFKQLADEYESTYYRLIKEMEDVSKDLSCKIICFIDDLDRCLPEQAICLLEGLKVFLDIKGFVFVIGVAKDVIEQGVMIRYRDLFLQNYDTADREKFKDIKEKYLDKIIQFPFILPPPVEEKIVELIESYLTKDNGLDSLQCYLDTIIDALEKNPRQLKRYLNILSFTKRVAAKKNEEIADENLRFKDELLIKMSLISFRFEKLYRLITSDPENLMIVQEKVWEIIELEEKVSKKALKVARATDKDDKDNENLEGRKNIYTFDFSKLEALDLFSFDNKKHIIAIFKKVMNKNRKDVGFKDGNEVKGYITLFAVTSAKEVKIEKKSVEDTASSIENRLIQIAGSTIKLTDGKSGNSYTANIPTFYLDIFPLTQSDYEDIMGNNPSYFKGNYRPVENVSWYMAVEFCNRLSEKMDYIKAYNIKRDGNRIVDVEWNNEANGFRLPTEAEWEFACCEGDENKNCTYGQKDLDAVAWYGKSSEIGTNTVKKLQPNKLGLYDMLGNVWEWCWDWYGNYPNGTTEYFTGPDDGDSRVIRGGGWGNDAGFVRSAVRGGSRPDYRNGLTGFRLARGHEREGG